MSDDAPKPGSYLPPGHSLDHPRYDSRPDTYAHIEQVREFLFQCVRDLLKRGQEHDASKLESPEREVFDEFTPRLRNTTYGSAEYKRNMVAMGEGLAHHYANNPHHPEFWPKGIVDMSLLDVLEMLCDWKAATMRHADGDLARSIRLNAERYHFGPEIEALLRNTAWRMGWIEREEIGDG